MLFLLLQSSKSIANSSSWLSTMEILFTQCNHICFPLFFLLCGFIYKILLLCSHVFVLFSYFLNIFIWEHPFLMFGHGFRTVSHWLAQVWKVYPSSKDFLNCSPPFWCVFANRTWDLSQSNHTEQLFISFRNVIWSSHFLPSCSLSLESFPYCSLRLDYLLLQASMLIPLLKVSLLPSPFAVHPCNPSIDLETCIKSSRSWTVWPILFINVVSFSSSWLSLVTP